MRGRGPALWALLLLSTSGACLAPEAAAAVPNPDPGLIARWQPCEPDTGVTVIVDRVSLGDLKVYVGCALGEQATGLDALHNAGFTTEGVGGGDAFVCRIGGQPTPAEESCAKTPGGCCYWSYWHGKPGGRWGYSGFGAASPLSRAPVNSVEGWGFGHAPRIEPMDGAGPSAFSLPPPQESSTRPGALARRWLTDALVRTAELELAPGNHVNHDTEETLNEVLALTRAGVSPVQLELVSDLLDGREMDSTYEYSSLQAWANSNGTGLGVDPSDPAFPLYGRIDRCSLAVLAVAALGHAPTSFAGADLRGELLARIDDASGKILSRASGGSTSKSANVADLAAVVEALAATGTLPAKAISTLDLLLAAQEGNAAIGLQTTRALIAARERMGISGLGPTRFATIGAELEGYGAYLEGLQEPDGGIRTGPSPTFKSTAAGAVGLALTGYREAARKAAKWVSRYQVTADYAGTLDPVTGEPAPAEGLIGAFFPTENDLKNALAYGIPSEGPHGAYDEAQLPTAEALEALTTAGPYGPLYATFDLGSLWFDSQIVGSQSIPQAATLTNRDSRPLEIGEAGLHGANPAEFRLDGGDCAGRTLGTGESCELSARFAPAAAGVREATAQLALEGTNQAFGLTLGGTGVPPASAPGGGRSPTSAPQGLRPGSASVAPVGGKQSVGEGRVAKLATLSCPAGTVPCQVKTPKRVRVQIGGHWYGAWVLAPKSLGAGESASLRIRLSRRASERLGADGATVRVRVWLTGGAGVESRLVEAQVET